MDLSHCSIDKNEEMANNLAEKICLAEFLINWTLEIKK